MCGIIGFTFEDKQLVRKLVSTLTHRGPDSQGIFTDKNVSLGHTRLSIIDLSEASGQPFIDDEGNVIVYNGEIYNYKSIRGELEKENISFKTTGDTEVLLKAWLKWGYRGLRKLNGMFAFAVYQPVKNRLTIVRDRYGIKPLYYYLFNNKIIFSSEIPTLLKSIRELNKEISVSIKGLNDYLTFRHTMNQTLIRGIKKLPPGNIIQINLNNDNTKIIRWYSLPIPKFTKTKHILSKIPVLLSDSVRLRMIADVPVGFFLSGGIDSGSITALAVKQKKQLGEPSDSIKTFSVGFESSSELPNAKETADFLGTDHHELVIREQDANLLNKIISYTGEPVGQPALIPTLLLSRYAKKKVTCVQAGEGADEIFGGYDRYKFLLYGKYLRHIARIAPKITNNTLYKQLILLNGKSEFEMYINSTGALINDSLGGISSFNNYKHLFKGRSFLQKISRMDMQTLLVNDFFIKADAMPMRASVEERVPFMDHRIVELGLSIRDSSKIRLWTDKWAFRKSSKSFLPPDLFKRPKRGYNVPMDLWFRKGGILNDQLSDLLNSKNHSYYDTKKAIKLLESFKPGNSYKQNFSIATKLYTILSFELWYEQLFK